MDLLEYFIPQSRREIHPTYLSGEIWVKRFDGDVGERDVGGCCNVGRHIELVLSAFTTTGTIGFNKLLAFK